MILLLTGCGKETKPTAIPAPAQHAAPPVDAQSSAQDPARPATVVPQSPDPPRAPVNVTPEDFAFVPSKAILPERFGVTDPRLVSKKTSEGVEVSMESPLKNMFLIYRKRLLGDFKAEIDFDYSPTLTGDYIPPNANSNGKTNEQQQNPSETPNSADGQLGQNDGPHRDFHSRAFCLEQCLLNIKIKGHPRDVRFRPSIAWVQRGLRSLSLVIEKKEFDRHTTSPVRFTTRLGLNRKLGRR